MIYDNPYEKVIEFSKRIRWEIERDVIRNRTFTLDRNFLPDGLSLADEMDFLTTAERRLFSQIQGRTYANLFGLVERFIGAKMLEISMEHALGDQLALEALVRTTDEELKHQALFRRIEELMAEVMPQGYEMAVEPNAVANAVLSKCSWAVLGLTCHIELFTQAHYRASIGDSLDLSPLWKDVFLFHWLEESQHAMVDELEWVRADEMLTDGARDAAVTDLIDLVVAVDGILQAQAKADTRYFERCANGGFTQEQSEQAAATFLKAYRWQYIVSGVMEPRFQKILGSLVTEAQMQRILAALRPLMYAVPQQNSALPMAA